MPFRYKTQENETTAESESETEEVTETETVEETSSEEPTIDLSTATKEDILYYIEAIGGDESDAFYTFIGSLGAGWRWYRSRFYSGK